MKRTRTPKIQDQVDRPLPREGNALPSLGLSIQKGPNTTEINPSLPSETVNYVTGRRERVSPTREPSELLIEGGPGSLMVDLRGMGVDLHPAAFAFRMPDDSMTDEQIRCGDIAIVEPCVLELQEGDIVMLALNGIATLRRVTLRGAVTYFQGNRHEQSPLLPAWEHAFSGVVTAVFRAYYHGRLLSRSQELDEKPSGRLKKPVKRRGNKKQITRFGTRLRDDPPAADELNWYAG